MATTVRRTEPISSGSGFMLFVLLCAAIAGNHLKLPLYFNIDLFFGSIFSMIVIQIFGFRWGVFCAVASSAYSWLILGYYLPGINFVGEAIFVGYFLSRSRHGLVFLSSLYWVLLGMPLIWLYFNWVSPLEPDMALLIMYKLGINGIFNALAATLIIILLPLSSLLAKISGKRQVTFQQIISTSLAAAVLFPLFALSTINIREEYNDEMRNASQEFACVADHAHLAVNSWLNEHFIVFSTLAQYKHFSKAGSGIHEYINQVKTWEKDILEIGLVDRNGETIFYDPPVDPEKRRSNIGGSVVDKERLKVIRAAQGPIFYVAKAGDGATRSAPVVIVNVPGVTDDSFDGYVTGVLGLQGLSEILVQMSKHLSCKVVLLDGNRRVITSSDPALKVMQEFQLPEGKTIAINSSTYQFVPTSQGKTHSLEQWQRSFYIQEIPVGLDSSWRLVVELPLERRLHYLGELFTKELLFMLVLVLLMLGFSSLVGSRLVLSLRRLQDATSGLPEEMSRQKEVDWPSSIITEISSLTANFKSVASTLSDKFTELTLANSELSRENLERRLVEEKLGQASSDMNAIFTAFPDLCLVVDAETLIIDCKGRDIEHMLSCDIMSRGQRLTEMLPPEVGGKLRDAVEEVLSSGSMVALEYDLERESFFEARLVPLTQKHIVIIVRNVTESKKAEELRASHEQLRNLSMHLEDAREKERSLIAREIHDELGQQLTALRFDLGWISRKLADGQHSMVPERIGSMAELIDTTIKSVRRIAMELRPRLLDDLGLVAAMEWQITEFEKRTGIVCTLNVGQSELIVEQRRATALFRIMQEALTNIIRHAGATRVDLFLSQDNDCLHLEVADNGKGISENESRSKSSFGIMGMHERAREWGGSVSITGEPGHGTTISVTIPLVE